MSSLRYLEFSLRILFDLFQLFRQSKRLSVLFDSILKSATTCLDIYCSIIFSLRGLLNLIMLKYLAFAVKFVLLGSLCHAYFYLAVLSVLCVGFFCKRQSFFRYARRMTLNQIFVICCLLWFKILLGKFDNVDFMR